MQPSLALTGLAVALALAGGYAASAEASPPPLQVKVLLASDPHLDAAARARHEAFLQSLSAGGPSGGWFELLPAGLDSSAFEHCTDSSQDPRTCASRLLAEKQVVGATVIVLASGQGDHAKWLCVGTGARPTAPERQSIRFDLDTGLDDESAARLPARAAAAGCITSAGAESGW